jgi:hypothetical protein
MSARDALVRLQLNGTKRTLVLQTVLVMNLFVIARAQAFGCAHIVTPSNVHERITGYDRNPLPLQALIRAIFREATARIHVHGTTIVPVPLFEVMDGKVAADYCERVEPSPQGSVKNARLVLDRVQAAVALTGSSVMPSRSAAAAVTLTAAAPQAVGTAREYNYGSM